MPWLRGIAEQHLHDQLIDIVLPYAQRPWEDVQKPDRGKIRSVHDHYLPGVVLVCANCDHIWEPSFAELGGGPVTCTKARGGP